MVGENFEFICLKLLELPKEPSNKFHDFGHFPKTFNKKEHIFNSLSGLNRNKHVNKKDEERMKNE